MSGINQIVPHIFGCIRLAIVLCVCVFYVSSGREIIQCLSVLSDSSNSTFCPNLFSAQKCFVDGVCYDEGDPHPDDPCQKCISGTTVSSFTPLGKCIARYIAFVHKII